MSKKSKKKVTVRAVKQAMRALGISSSHPFAEEGALPYVYTASSAEIELCYIEYGDISPLLKKLGAKGTQKKCSEVKGYYLTIYR